MKKIDDYRKLLEVTKTTNLKDLKTAYRNAMKAWHPDKFVEDNQEKIEAEEKSKLLIEAYHFLESIAPETIEKELPDYTKTITLSNIQDIIYDRQVLRIDFLDGSSYEYFDVPKNTYIKLINADSQGRLARRHIYNSFLYRNIKR